mmetsp:Transcript_10284/g.22025  ORF Transcript_10284/g.22025 Transcript_10284/m.22025 type:complete len:680 (+) Transcript_10284:98-2137(+)
MTIMRCFTVVPCIVAAAASASNPISKVLELLSEMRGKIVAEGESEQAAYEEFGAWCRTESKEMQREVQDAKTRVAELTATIEKSTAEIEDLDASIAELNAATKTVDQELADAKEVRAKEKSDYQAVDADLVETIDMIERAVSVLERELPKNGFLQKAVHSPDVADVLEGLKALVAATTVSAHDSAKLDAFLQAADGLSQAPEAAAYETHGGSMAIIDTLNDMLETAERQKAEADKAEAQSEHDYKMLKASLESSIRTQKKERDEAKKQRLEHVGIKADAEGDIDMAQNELSKDIKTLNDAHDDCEERAHEWDTSMQSRAHEIEALDMATKVLKEKTGAAQDAAYSFLQTAATHRQIPSSTLDQVVQSLVSLGKQQRDKQLAMLAMRVRQGSAQSDDPFKKVKDLINEMVEKLETEAAEEAKQKEFCDKETKETKEKKEELESHVEALSSNFDETTAQIRKLKQQISTLSTELTDVAKSQKEATKMRIQEKAEFEKLEADYSAGLEGVQMALKVLRDYYGQSFMQMDVGQPETPSHSKKSDGASSIIGILEVAESDFGRLLAEARETEMQAQTEYDEMTEDNKVDTTTKTADVKGKKAQVVGLEHDLSEVQGDREAEQEELDAVNEYMSELNSKCVAKPEPYEERKRRREAEMEGLQTALDILDGKAMAFLAVNNHVSRA